ncbi:hypothetical protein C4569_02180 [Candidatus Parcubacteria bacterium]|nr:MAG: hypothetical protein C4569_02180 [Candidatus Parcubacteria bacterium]
MKKLIVVIRLIIGVVSGAFTLFFILFGVYCFVVPFFVKGSEVLVVGTFISLLFAYPSGKLALQCLSKEQAEAFKRYDPLDQ